MIIFNRIALYNFGADFYLFNKWIGGYLYWQSIPLFGFINSHRKSNTLHEYGFIIFGLWVVFKVDT